MEKGPSTYAEYWTSPYNEVKYFNDHGWQMGLDNYMKKYLSGELYPTR